MSELARWLTKTAAVAPGLLVSTVVTSMVGAVLPPVAGLALFVAGLGLVVLLFEPSRVVCRVFSGLNREDA